MHTFGLRTRFDFNTITAYSGPSLIYLEYALGHELNQGRCIRLRHKKKNQYLR